MHISHSKLTVENEHPIKYNLIAETLILAKLRESSRNNILWSSINFRKVKQRAYMWSKSTKPFFFKTSWILLIPLLPIPKKRRKRCRSRRNQKKWYLAVIEHIQCTPKTELQCNTTITQMLQRHTQTSCNGVALFCNANFLQIANSTSDCREFASRLETLKPRLVASWRTDRCMVHITQSSSLCAD